MAIITGQTKSRQSLSFLQLSPSSKSTNTIVVVTRRVNTNSKALVTKTISRHPPNTAPFFLFIFPFLLKFFFFFSFLHRNIVFPHFFWFDGDAFNFQRFLSREKVKVNHANPMRFPERERMGAS